MGFEDSLPRQGFVSAAINSLVYIWGGQTASGNTSHLETLYILDTRTETWMSRKIEGQHPSGFHLCTAAQDGNLLYIYGGEDEHGKHTGSLYCLDLENRSWKWLSSHIPGGPKKKRSGGMVVHGDKIFLLGGFTSDFESSNELHMFDLSTGSWSSRATTGSKPPQCKSFSFLKVRNDVAMLFGGVVNGRSISNQLYTLDLNNMHWTKEPHKDEEPWPEEREHHAACCVGMDDASHTQLLIIGGANFDSRTIYYYDDMWLLNITSMTRRKVKNNTRMKRYRHAAITVPVTEDVNEVVLFGGRMLDVPHLSKTTILRFEKKQAESAAESSPGEWNLTDVADSSHLGTRERLQYKKDLREKENERIYQKVIAEQISVPLQIARLNFLGLPRSGKSTTIKRLIGEILNILQAKLTKEQASTGVAERNQVMIRSISKYIGFASSSKWSQKDLLGESGVLHQFIKEVAKSSSSAQKNLPKLPQVSNEAAPPLIDRVDTPSSAMPHEEKPLLEQSNQETSRQHVLALFQEAVSSEAPEDLVAVKYHLGDTIYLINTDTGGHTEFLDLTSRFIMGPALNLIVSRLVDSLNKVYKIYSTNEEGISTAEEDSVVTVEDVIFQALASIACLKASHSLEGSANEKDADIQTSECSSKAMFVGTFRDMVTQEEFEKKDRLLRKKLEQTEYFHNSLVLCASDRHLMFTLDNLEGDQNEINSLRQCLEVKIKKYFEKVDTPLSWLMLSVNIRHKNKRTMSLRECRAIAVKLGISAASLPKALWFLHYRVGILLYYPEIEGFSQLIICDIQVVFDAATKLVKKTFTNENVEPYIAEMFKEKAQFTMADLQVATKECVTNLIPLEKLVVLLEHHKILAPLPQHGVERGEVIYFMPCILKSATPAELLAVCSSVAPLMFRYECGYMPLGVFSSLIIQLVSHHHNDWTLVEDGPCRNKVEFIVGEDYDKVTLVSRPTFMEVALLRKSDPTRPTYSVCADVRSALTTALEDVHTDLKFHCTAKFQYAFECPSHPGKEHLCVLPKKDGNTLLCLENKKNKDPVRMKNPKQQVWFKEIDDKALHAAQIELTSKWIFFILMILLLVGASAFMLFRAMSASNSPSSSQNTWATHSWSLDSTPQLSDFLNFPGDKDSKNIDIVEAVASEYERLGILLGLTNQIRNIKYDDAYRTSEDRCRGIIDKWLLGKGSTPVTWRTFLSALEAMKYLELMDSIHARLGESSRSESKEL